MKVQIFGIRFTIDRERDLLPPKISDRNTAVTPTVREGQALPRSARGREWLLFSDLVLDHIETYTVRQYGDKPNDQLEKMWTVEDCIKAIAKYVGRYGAAQRGQAEEDRDLLKIAHYACVAFTKRVEGRHKRCTQKCV